MPVRDLPAAVGARRPCPNPEYVKQQEWGRAR